MDLHNPLPRSLPRLVIVLGLAGSLVVARMQRAPAAVEPDWRDDVLVLAFDAASALPLDPHVKTRSRLQGEVTSAWLERGRPDRATAAAESIADWRRGLAHAEIAAWHARRGERAEAVSHLTCALETVDAQTKDATSQAWRSDRIRAVVASAWLVLGDAAQARAAAHGLAESEAARVDAERARTLPLDEVDAAFASYRTLVANGSLDRVRGALEACAALFARLPSDDERCISIASFVRDESRKVPPEIRIEVLLAMADATRAQGDHEAERGWVEAARAIVDAERWLPADFVAQLATVAAARVRSGDRDTARCELNAVIACYDAERDSMVDIDRADALRPAVAVCGALGDREIGITVMRRVVADGATNPNARPRAEDLVATCVAIVSAGIEPDAEVLARLQVIREGLEHPW